MGLLIKGFDNYVFDALEDKIMLMAINVENACEQLGLEPGGGLFQIRYCEDGGTVGSQFYQ